MVFVETSLCVEWGLGKETLSIHVCDLTVELLQTMINDLYHQGSLQMPIPWHDTDYPIVQYADDTL